VTPSVGCDGSGCLSAWGCGVHATDEPRESVSDRLVAVKKVDSAIQLWSKMQIADADRLSKIKSNVKFQKYSPLSTPLAPTCLSSCPAQFQRHAPKTLLQLAQSRACKQVASSTVV
jgi:hypothetical protein